MSNTQADKYRMQGRVCIVLCAFILTLWALGREKIAYIGDSPVLEIVDSVAGSDRLCRPKSSGRYRHSAINHLGPCQASFIGRHYLWLRLDSGKEFLINASATHLDEAQHRMKQHPERKIAIFLNERLYAQWHKKKNSIAEFRSSGSDDAFKVEMVNPDGSRDVLVYVTNFDSYKNEGGAMLFIASFFALAGAYSYWKARRV